MVHSRPVNVSIFLDEERGEDETVASAQLRCNPDFRVFAERMAATGHTFVVRKKPGGNKGSAGVANHPAAVRNSNKNSSSSSGNGIHGRKSNAHGVSATTKRVPATNTAADAEDASPLDIISLDRAVDETSSLTSTREQWLRCCLREYLQRKHYFTARFVDRRHLAVRILVMVLPCMLLLWWIWPMWDVLLDADSSYYTALGVATSATPEEIKRTYRAQIKQWHPDHNPGCGEKCRVRMREMQEAYDTLMARGSKRFDLAKQYHEQILTLRSLITFRLHTIIAESSQGVAVLLLALAGSSLSPGQARLVSMTVKVCVMLFFILYECLFVSGFNAILIGSVIMFTIVRLRMSAGQAEMERRKRTANVDFIRASVVCVSSLTLLAVVHTILQHQHVNRRLLAVVQLTTRALYPRAGHPGAAGAAGDSAESGGWFGSRAGFLHMAWGVLYVIAFLYRFAPNVYDNIVMRRCSLALCYLSPATHSFSVMRFVSAELGFIADDVFAFTCRVPWLYRAMVYLVHVVYLCQLKLLPWDGPVIHKRGQHAWITPDAASREWSARAQGGRPPLSSQKVDGNSSTNTAYSLANAGVTPDGTHSCEAETALNGLPAQSSVVDSAQHNTEPEQTRATQEVHNGDKDACTDSTQTTETTQSAVPVTMLTPKEALMIANLDALTVHWVDVVSARYAVELDRCNRLCKPGTGCVIQLFYTANMQTMMICKLRVKAVDAAEMDGNAHRVGVAGAAVRDAAAPKLEVLLAVHDPDSCRLIAREKGGTCVPNDFAQVASGRTRRRHEDIYRSATGSLYGDNASDTAPVGMPLLRTSQLWRSRTAEGSSALWFGAMTSSGQSVAGAGSGHGYAVSWVVLTLFALLVSQVVWHLSADPSALLEATRMLPATLQPRVLSRFSSLLPVTHDINRVAAGSLMVWRNRLMLCTVDISDALSHLSFSQANRTG